MYFHIFKLRCLTNLHVGSGDINYNIVDKEVEKDPVTGIPNIHASGIKGAMLKHFQGKMAKNELEAIFGAPGAGEVSKPGSYRFLDACLLSRPMRTENGQASSVSVTTEESVQRFLNDVSDFSGKDLKKTVPALSFGSAKFLATEDCCVEGLKTAALTPDQKQKTAWLKKMIGERFAFVENFRDYDLPVIARNHLNNGISENLWYEEFVPHGSVFYMVIMTPNAKCELDFSEPIQIGGNASVGYGFTKIEEIDLNTL